MYNTYKITFVRKEPRPNRISVGMQGDNLVTTVLFTVDPIDDRMAAHVKLELPDGPLMIPLTMTNTGYIWDIRRSTLKSHGRFPAQLLVQDHSGDIVWQSEIFHVDVGKSILFDNNGEASAGDELVSLSR